jgi:integrase
VTAIERWRTAADINDGPLFLRVDRHRNVHPERLTPQAVNLVIKRAAERADMDPSRLTGHSLRAGFATTASANGATEAAIARQTGHKSMDVLRTYIRHGTVFTDNAVTTLGL